MALSNNKWRLQRIPIEKLLEYDENPREIDENSFEGLLTSIERFGYVEPIVWNERTGRIVGGHQRLKALKAKGMDMPTVVVVDMDDADELAANLTLNNPEIEGEWDDPVNDLLADLRDANEDLYYSLNLPELEGFIESMAIKGSKDESGDDNDDDEDSIDELSGQSDTQCPCCGFEWKIEADDVQVMSPEEQELARAGKFKDDKE